VQVVLTKKEPPRWLLDMWKEIDDKTFGKGFDCFTEDAVCNLGVADWKGREAIRTNLKAFIDTGFTAQHHVTEYWDGGFLKVFRRRRGYDARRPVEGNGTSYDDPFLLNG
jgi:SnoaL-like domain